MILWYFLAGIAVLLVLFMALPWTWTVAVNEQGDFRSKLRFAGIPLRQTPPKEKKVRLRDYSKRAMRRRQKKQASATPSKQPRGNSASTDDAPLTDKISHITEIASSLLTHSLSRAHVRVKRLAITVGSPDAARTAILYGAIAPALALLLETLEQFSHLHISPDAPVGVAADFVAEHIRADIHIRFRLSMWHLIGAFLHSAFRSMSRMKNSSQSKHS